MDDEIMRFEVTYVDFPEEELSPEKLREYANNWVRLQKFFYPIINEKVATAEQVVGLFYGAMNVEDEEDDEDDEEVPPQTASFLS
jgi:cytochrome P450